MSEITLKFSGDNVDVDIVPIVIDSSLQEDPDVKKIVDEYLGKFRKCLKYICICI